MNPRKALISMHYEESLPGVWSKAVGFHLFTYVEKSDLFRNYFRDAQGKHSVYNERELMFTGSKDPLLDLKYTEAECRIDTPCSSNSHFESSILALHEDLHGPPTSKKKNSENK